MNKTLHLSLCDNTFHYHLQVKIIEFLNTFLSKKTQNSYLSDLKFFFAFLKNHLSIEIPDVSSVASYYQRIFVLLIEIGTVFL